MVSSCLRNVGMRNPSELKGTNRFVVETVVTFNDMGSYMLQCIETGEARLFREIIRPGYSLENVWGHEATKWKFSAVRHDRS